MGRSWTTWKFTCVRALDPCAMLHGLGLLRQQYTKYAAGSSQSPESTIQVLAQKLSDATLAREDRRAALLSLRALTRDHAAAVGEHALIPLLRWIKTRESDEEMLRAAVEACLSLCQVPQGDTSGEGHKRAVSNMHRLLDEPDALLALLALLAPAHAFYTRFAALQLLATLLEHRRADVQEKVLAAPGGCSAVLQCLEAAPTSSTEIIRNEALLLLPSLASGSADIQKIIAFEGAFERLLDIIAQEGRIEGGVVVQDALTGLEALLVDNGSNQNYFRETLSIPLLAPLLFFPPPLPPSADELAKHEYSSLRDAFLLQEWDEEKLANALLLVRCIRHLVDGHGDDHRENQRAMRNSGLTECLVQLVFASLAPPLLKAQTLHLLASVLRNSRQNQDLLSTSVVTPVALVRREDANEEMGEPPFQLSWQAPQPAMLCLIALALRGPGATEMASQAMAVRTAALAAFDALVAQNVDVRMTLLHALVAAPAPGQNHGNSNQLLLESIAHLPSTSLVSSTTSTKFDASQYLFASLMLSSLLHGSDTTKEFARRIHLDQSGRCVASATLQAPEGDEDPPTTLLHLIVGNLAMAMRELGEAVRRERAAAADANTSSSEDWTRVIVGYLVLLCHWLWQSPESVADLISESANLQVVLQPVAQSSGVDVVIQGLAAFVLGELYEFNPLTSQEDGVLTRQAMHPILYSRIGPDAFSTRLVRLKSDPRFATVGPDVFEQFVTLAAQPGKDDTPQLYFSWLFVEFWKEHYARMQKAVLVEPDTTSASSAESSAELLDARQQITTLTAELHRVQAEAALVDGLRADAAKAQAEAAESTQLREQLAAVRNVLDETKKALDEAHQQLRAQTGSAKESNDEHAQASEKLRAEHAAATERLRAELGADSRRRQEEHAAELEKLRQELFKETQLREEHQNELARLREEHAKGAAPADDAQLAQENEDLLVLLDELSTKHKRNKARMRMQGWDVSEDEDDDDNDEL